MSFEFFIGSRYLKVKKGHAFISLITILSVAGVTMGVMALIIVISVMSGFESDLKTRILGVKSHVDITRGKLKFKNYEEITKKIKQNKTVKAATPYVSAQVMIRSDVRAAGAIIKGIDPDSAVKVILKLDPTLLKETQSRSKSIAPTTHLPGIILGKELARNMGVITGDTVEVISARGYLTPVGHMPAVKRFVVVGLFEVGMYEYDGTLAFILLTEAQKFLRMPNEISGIEIRLTNLYAAAKVEQELKKMLGKTYQVKDWIEMNQNLFSALKLEKAAMFIILALIIFVAAFNIASSLIMMVIEKTKDIAILKAMGASDKSIRKIFIYKGMIIGGIGVCLGMVLGLGVCLALARYHFIQLPSEVYYITNLPVQIEFLNVCLIAVSALSICFLATLYPSHRASKRNPVEAIRYG
jgi:lipoprotein-releasing system permease protein